ncbi:MAG TPA: hypothetical protein VK837_00890 [Longimicrobiales bacterium]|nr:hypothetical protein [Longimicrobiales bacterium]
MASDGRIVEIHVLSTPEFHPKQVVRNVESALSAGLRIDIDRRIISVSQLEEDFSVVARESESVEDAPPAATDAPPAHAANPVAAPENRAADAVGRGGLVIPLRPSGPPVPAERVRFAGIRTHTHSARSIACEVRLTLDGADYVGRADAPDTETGRLGAAARATFTALENALGEAPALLEGVTAVDADAGRYVLVLARGSTGRDAARLVGAARMRGAVEDAAVLATLQALDRWLSSDFVAG